MTGFYVTCIRGDRVGWLYGPCGSHSDAIGMIDACRIKAREIDPWTDFDAFGTAKLERQNLPSGRLNQFLGAAA